MRNLNFKVSTNMKTIIGKELVTNANIAIFELVKNSYDAKASRCWIVFKDLKSGKDPKIIIVDDGKGMSYQDLVSKWLFLGYSDKRDEPTQTSQSSTAARQKPHRVFAGAKGIGRFSCDRLGSTLVLHTKVGNEEAVHKLQVDWSRFEVDQKELFQNMTAAYSSGSRTDIEGFDLAKMGHGTILEIGSLRDHWDKEGLRALKRYLQRLVTPSFNEDASADFIIDVRAAEFIDDDEIAAQSEKGIPAINGRVENFVFENLGIKTTFISSHIGNGKVLTKLTDKDALVFELGEENTYSRLNNVDVKIFYLNAAAKQSFTKQMGMVPKEYGSVFLYKNEFRIHPYGDVGDDWLGLEERKGQGTRRYLSKRDLIGTVLLTGPQPDLKEVSSRDAGVIRNEAFYELTDFIMTKVLRRLERYVEGVIEWDTAAAQEPKDREGIEARSLELVSKLVQGTRGPNSTIKVGPAVLETLRENFTGRYPQILGNLQSLADHVPEPKQRDMLESAIKSFRTALAKSESERAVMRSDLAAKEQQIFFLEKTLSPETKALLGHIHQIKLYAQRIESDSASLVGWARSTNAPADIVDTIANFSIEAKKILILSRFSTRANFDLTEEEVEMDVVAYVTQYLSQFGKAKRDVLRPIQILNNDFTHVSVFKPVTMAIVLDNLLDNSRKNGGSVVSVKFEQDGRKLLILFGDNGMGIDPEVAKHIFQMGYSTTRGSGLGLYQCRTIMRDSLKGNITFIGNNKDGLGSGACFQVTIP